jgi:primosomal protein N' (replication factor Y)
MNTSCGKLKPLQAGMSEHSTHQQQPSDQAASHGPVVWLQVALDVPLAGVFDYSSTVPVAPGTRVIVPFGRRTLVGMVLRQVQAPGVQADTVKPIEQVLNDLPPMPPDWLRLAGFACQYYQRPPGEVMLPVLPAALRKVSAYQGKRSAGGPVCRLDRAAQKAAEKAIKEAAKQAAVRDQEAAEAAGPGAVAAGQGPGAGAPPQTADVNGLALATPAVHDTSAITLNPAQQQAVDAIGAIQGHKTLLLHGVTGSGKTEVYLHAALQVLQRGRQVLLMVPEINLTPQLEQALRRRLQPVIGADGLAVMHSGLADGQRLQAWLAAFRGQARLVLGTRLSVFVPMPDLGLIVVDEEHDTSYKQQEGLRYSARDLAIWRGHDLNIPVVLGSATPALETWHHAQSGRYLYQRLDQRARAASPPDIRLLDTRRMPMQHGFAPQTLQAIEESLQAGRQVLVFLNRRGFAPVLHCASCGWVSQCPRCTAYTVLHRAGPVAPGRQRHGLHCHHCGYQVPVPRACPECGDQDLKPMGRGTQRVEHDLAELFPQARIARIDADSTRLKGSAAELFRQMHEGQVDILVGTQMVSKGHDFTNLGVVCVLNADTMLFAHDFRAPERLFAQLMQVAGRAGRHGQKGQVIIQTDYPDQPVYQALKRHDFVGFATHCLQEREAVGLPPFAWQALLTAEARELATAMAFLQEVRNAAGPPPTVSLYDPVPLRVVRVANIERAQLLVESSHRPALQGFLAQWGLQLQQHGRSHRVRYTLEVDPLEI